MRPKLHITLSPAFFAFVPPTHGEAAALSRAALMAGESTACVNGGASGAKLSTIECPDATLPGGLELLPPDQGGGEPEVGHVVGARTSGADKETDDTVEGVGVSAPSDASRYVLPRPPPQMGRTVLHP